MSDHAKTVARLCAPMPAEAYEALDALVAERDELKAWTMRVSEGSTDAATAADEAIARAEAAEARVVVLEAECAAWGEGCKQREATIRAAEARVTELEAALAGVAGDLRAIEQFIVERHIEGDGAYQPALQARMGLARIAALAMEDTA